MLDSSQKVLKWDAGHWRDTDAWNGQLTEMFGGPSADVFHIVVFNKTPAKYAVLREALGKIKYELFGGAEPRQGSLASKYGIKDVWLAKLQQREGRPLFDDTTGGRLSYGPNSGMTYVLAVRLPDQEKLEAFMRDPEHLKLRLKFFAQLGGAVESVMQEFAIREPADFRQLEEPRGKILYESLESMASMWMRRYDYHQDESISELVRFQPRAFP